MNLYIKISDIAILNELFNIFLILLGAFIIFYFIILIISYFAFKKTFIMPKKSTNIKSSNRWNDFKVELDANKHEFEMINKEKIVINGYNNKKISGYFIKSNSNSKDVIIFSHGWKSSGISDYLCCGMFWHRLDKNVLIIDHYGYNDSEGKYVNFGGNIDTFNIQCWVDYINEKFNHECQIYLHGVSMGASILLSNANLDLNNVKAIIADSGYVNAYEQIKEVVKKQHKIIGNLISFNIKIYANLLAHCKLNKCDTKNSMIYSKYPILFIHGEKDYFVKTPNSIINYNLCNSIKEIIIYDDASHMKSYMTHKKKYVEDIKKFINTKKD